MKPFKGVISNWYRDGDVVVGKCEFHPDMEDQLTLEALLRDGLVRGYGMHTSKVESIEDRGSFSICETKNSMYVLIDARS